MGRQAPEQQFEFVACFNQTTGNIPNYQEAEISNGAFSNGIFIISPIGNINAVPAAQWINMRGGNPGSGSSSLFPFGSNKGVPYPNNTIVYVSQEKRALYTFQPTFITGNVGYLGNSASGTNTAKPIYGIDTTGVVSSTFGIIINPVLPNVRFNQTNVGYPNAKYAEYVDLHSTFGLLLTFNNYLDLASGHSVGLQTITHSATGITTGAITTISDTLNANTNITGTSSKLVFPCIVEDTSYTGTVSRVLIGYQAMTGVTSGQLCARLAEIDAGVITLGDPVVVRSIVSPAACYRQSIKACYHSKGTASGSFVITTTVANTTDPTKATSGEIIACNPASGLTLSGTFGTPATIFNSNTTGTTGFVSRSVCQAMNTWTGVSGLGVVCAITSGASGTSTSGALAQQRYYLSGTVISTGAIFTFATGAYNTLCNWASGSTNPTSTADQTNYLYEIPLTQSGGNSGVFDYIDVFSTGTITGTINYYAGAAASGFISRIRVPAALSGGTTISGLDSVLSYSSGGGFRISPLQYVPSNPYSGGLASAYVIDRQVSFGRVVTIGAFLQLTCLTISDSSLRVAGSGSISLSSGSNYLPPSMILSEGLPSTGFPYAPFINHIKSSGTFPNITSVYLLAKQYLDSSGINIKTLNFSSGLTNAGYAMSSYSGVFSNFSSTLPGDLQLGIVINPSTTVSGIVSLPSGALTPFPLSGIVVKVAKTQQAKRQIVEQGLKTFNIVDARNFLDPA